ncbi:MAG: hypothetical protein P8X90_27010, partial [Desulfobacterales bacterium]
MKNFKKCHDFSQDRRRNKYEPLDGAGPPFRLAYHEEQSMKAKRKTVTKIEELRPVQEERFERQM